MRKLLLIFMINIISMSIFCEEEKAKKKIPMKAAALSLIVPGGGQFYNESYLKCGIVAGLELTFIGLAVNHHIKAEDWYDKFELSQNDEDYAKYVDYYNKRQSDIWWAGIVIFLSTIDAYVDAHLYDYDETKDKIRLKFEDNMVSLEYRF
ncbi:MAG: hypothetical protein K9N09_09935 [Candidatus Cloacimonetes bacterium]|nr:hypothetical protein [Candidatus Cloacimonadota bacterium]MCF7814427.1 hypothetical protein [Candidatus Cloacimonadota bacterium]MCF7869011.1 hypothetical protein [Candidatus Cloacimonadota bacterium]MCF7884411.1 hypothetical protein [Candidatus Cloacimonadota bacterium]